MSSKDKGARWIDLTEEQKQEVFRIRNAESAKRSRQKKRDENKKMEETYAENQKRLESLEKVVEKLSSELSSQTSGTSSSRTGKSSSRKGWKPDMYLSFIEVGLDALTLLCKQGSGIQNFASKFN